jgi:hypothetical protein
MEKQNQNQNQKVGISLEWLCSSQDAHSLLRFAVVTLPRCYQGPAFWTTHYTHCSTDATTLTHSGTCTDPCTDTKTSSCIAASTGTSMGSVVAENSESEHSSPCPRPPPLVSVTYTADDIRVVCEASYDIPSDIPSAGVECKSDYLCFLATNLSPSALHSLLEKLRVAGVVTGAVIAVLDKTYFLVKQSDAALSACALQELWDDRFTFSFLDIAPMLPISALKSRQLTILGSLYRFYRPITTIPSSIVIHCLGAESKEFTNYSSMISDYGLLFNSLCQLGVSKLQLAFIGPNLYPNENIHTSFMFEDKLTVDITVCCDLYHDFILQQQVDGSPSISTSSSAIDLVVLFQAGLWGYDSWHPTLQVFAELPITQIVVTSYSLLEGENDFDTLEEHCLRRNSTIKKFVWNFEDESNPYACTEPIPRTSAPDCDTYFDNCAWQSVRFVEN